jgi:hypothetical protein
MENERQICSVAAGFGEFDDEKANSHFHHFHRIHRLRRQQNPTTTTTPTTSSLSFTLHFLLTHFVMIFWRHI